MTGVQTCALPISDQDRYYFASGIEHYYELGREYRTGEPHSRPWDEKKKTG